MRPALIRDYKIAMKRAAAALPADRRPSVPEGFALNGVWGRYARQYARALSEALGLPRSERLNRRLRKALAPYLPVRYRHTNRILYLAAGHAGFYNRMPLLPRRWESKETIRVVDELAAECRRRGGRVVVVPHSLDLGASVEFVLRNAPKGAYCWELHYNAGPASVRGWLTAYSAGNRRSWQMARDIAREVRQAGFPIWGRGIITSATIGRWNGWDDIGWHRRPNAAGLVPNLLEMGFGTNRYDAWWWKTARKRAALIGAMADAIYPPA